jgi:hypothetical protein
MKDELEAALEDDEIESRKVPRLMGGGRKPGFDELEEDLHD